ncbi:PAS domain S-box protein [Azospirillum melinis]|uniref:PAS domain S-box protein n=1 Tax=Azospirillum melinis TaxID=328839 RepID=A0ABX2KHW4_9PROT|nr:PAS domain S-box protein [Azospirillum melinis]MBP2308890.1 PAS domain S-box-containing protein [Azospirillum melinis]NUA99378.1 PAS domain S-box protein [Azospirillum melinis]
MAPRLPEQPTWALDVLGALDAGILLLDRHCRVLYWNGWMEQASTLTAREILGHDLFDALPNLRESRLHIAVRDTLATGAPGVLSHTLNPMLFPLRLPDGRRMVHNVVIRPLPTHASSPHSQSAGNEARCLIQVTDVTASVNRERVLREQRDARYRAIVDTAPDAIITTDTRGMVQWMNGTATRQFDYRPDELIGQSVAVLLGEDAPDWIAMAEGSGPGAAGIDTAAQPVELSGRRRDGSHIDLELSMARWESEGRSFITGILRDITERRRTREELRTSALAMRQLAEQTKATLDALPAFIAVLDRSGHIVSVNRAWAEAGPETTFLGQGCIVGDDYLDHCGRGETADPRADTVMDSLRRLLSEGGPPVSAEYITNNQHWFRCLAAPMPAGPFGGTVLMHIDVTEIKSMEAALRKLVGQKSTLLREVNHRVKNSLQLVSSLLTLQTLSLPDEGVRVHFQDARSRIEAIARVHNRLYQADQFQTIEFGTYLNELCEDLARASGGDSMCDIAVRSDVVDLPIDHAAPLGLIANELITNAVKHRGNSAARVTVTFRREGEKLALTVSDRGPGLPSNFDIRKSRSLGMRLISSLAGQIRASVDIDTATQGTTFRIELPVPDEVPLLETSSPEEISG